MKRQMDTPKGNRQLFAFPLRTPQKLRVLCVKPFKNMLLKIVFLQLLSRRRIIIRLYKKNSPPTAQSSPPKS
ncbi:MAG: hypothetical protein V4642_14030 [Bacteroidota bacterium]